MSMRQIESGFATVKIGKFGQKQLVYSHYDHPEKFTFYINLPEGEVDSVKVSAYRGDMNEFDAKDLTKRKEFLEKSKERAANGGGETKGPITRPVAKPAVLPGADPEMDESFNF